MAKKGYSDQDRQEFLLLRETIQAYLVAPSVPNALRIETERLVSVEQIANMEAALSGKKGRSYRDGILIQLAYKLIDSEQKATKRPDGARGLAKKLAQFLKAEHIPAVDDSYQNIAKNTDELCRGNFLEWDTFLTWAQTASSAQLEACLQLACATVAAEARPVPPLPEIDSTKLTFARVMDVYLRLLCSGSQGVFEQYIVGSLMYALLGYDSSQYRIETKKINASDASSGAAGDVELFAGGRLMDAVEITAANWRDKLHVIGKKIKEHDLSRIHVVAPLELDYASVIADLKGNPEDVSVLDLKATVACLVATQTKPQRKVALHRLYEYLDRYQEDVDKLSLFVRTLTSQGLTVDAVQ